MKRIVVALFLLAASPVFATGRCTTTIPQQQECPDCICPECPEAPSCPDCTCRGLTECPDCICPEIPPSQEIPDCVCNCPDPCPPADNEPQQGGVYTMIGIGGANAWNTAEVTLGTFTIYGSGDIGWGYQCVVAGGIDRRGCQAYMLRRK